MYEKLKFPGFKPYLKEIDDDSCSCGGHVCSVISHISLDYIKDLHPLNDDWSEEWVLSFLALAGYESFKVPDELRKYRKKWKPFLCRKHLLLAVLMVDEKESTWAVIYKDKVHHGKNLFKGLSAGDVILNCPVQHIWIITKTPQYKKKR
jgi:hypothetical protein